MLQPEEDTDKWFNLLVMHQNRTKRATVDKNHIPEHFIDSMFDLVRGYLSYDIQIFLYVIAIVS